MDLRNPIMKITKHFLPIHVITSINNTFATAARQQRQQTKFTTTKLEPSKSGKVLYESSENEDMTQRSSPSTSVRPTRPRFTIKKQARPHIWLDWA